MERLFQIVIFIIDYENKNILILIFTMLVLISCSGKNNENLVDDFLTTYFNQANYSETEWQKLKKSSVPKIVIKS